MNPDGLPGLDYPWMFHDPDVLDVVYDKIDDLILSGHLEEVDNILLNVDVNSISTSIILSYLTVTSPIKTRFSRQQFFRRAHDCLHERQPTEAQELLRGLN